MTLGWRVLGSREALMTFFNTHSDVLGGRPLDLAVDSDEGLADVEHALRREASDADARVDHAAARG